MKTITKQQLIDMKPCDLNDRIEMFGKHETMNIKQAFKVGFTIDDVLWVCGELQLSDVIVKFANACSDRAQDYADAADAAAACYAAHYAARCADYAADDAADAADACYAARYAAAACYAARYAADAAEIQKQKDHLMELLK